MSESTNKQTQTYIGRTTMKKDSADTYYEVTNEDSGALRYICATRALAEKRAAELTRKTGSFM